MSNLNFSTTLLRQVSVALLVASFFSYFVSPIYYTKINSAVNIIICFFGVISYTLMLYSSSKKIPVISFSFMFVVGYLIVFYQVPLLDLFGYELVAPFHGFVWADLNFAGKSIAVATIGFLSYVVGFSFGLKNIRDNFFDGALQKFNDSYVVYGAYLFYVLFVLNSGSYIYGDYSAVDSSAYAPYFYKLFKVFLTAAVILRVVKTTYVFNEKVNILLYNKVFGYDVSILVVWHILFSIYVGDRGPAVYFLILFLGVYFARYSKINSLYLIGVVFIGSVFFSFVGDVRQARFSGGTYIERLEEIFERSKDEPSRGYSELVPFNSTVELAYSVRTLNHAVSNVPKDFDYMYGAFQAGHLYSILPGVSGYINKVFFNNNFIYDGSANFITFLIQGENPTYGDGTSSVADFYLDFGVLGVFVGFLILGFFIGANEYKLQIGKRVPDLSWISFMVFFSNSLYINRGAVLADISNIVLVYFVIKIFVISEK